MKKDKIKTEELPIERLYCDVNLPEGSTFHDFLREVVVTSPDTYYEDGTLQMAGGKTRSLDVLYSLVVTQYPEVSFEEFVKAASDIAVDLDGCLINCSDAKRITLYLDDRASSFNHFKDGSIDDWSELGLVKTCEINNEYYYRVFGKYSISDIYEILTNRIND